MRSARTPGTASALGSVLLLAAIGLAITFGVMGVINMAHGEMVMLGAYTVSPPSWCRSDPRRD
jgi:branched-subunit amino acid ABC-type transport system permease component